VCWVKIEVYFTCHVLILTPLVVPENLAPLTVIPETNSLAPPSPKLPMLKNKSSTYVKFNLTIILIHIG
jgi:hypothetical protein